MPRESGCDMTRLEPRSSRKPPASTHSSLVASADRLSLAAGVPQSGLLAVRSRCDALGVGAGVLSAEASPGASGPHAALQ